ncbi:MAG: DUF1353 domain-containing protein [Methanobacterium sp.]
MSSIKYKDGYKYQLSEDYSIQTRIKHVTNISDWIQLDAEGVLTIKKGYAWDGPSGPTIDTRNFMRGSLVHDALYQLMREDKLPLKYRNYADRLLQDICLEDGMTPIRAWWVYQGVHLFGKGPASRPEKNPVTAP